MEKMADHCSDHIHGSVVKRRADSPGARASGGSRTWIQASQSCCQTPDWRNCPDDTQQSLGEEWRSSRTKLLQLQAQVSSPR